MSDPKDEVDSGDQTSATIQADLDVARIYAVGIGPSGTDVDEPLVKAALAFRAA